MEKLTVKAKVKEFEINDPTQPFKGDRLGRKEYAEVLTSIVETFVGGAVVALNGAWGTGKTHYYLAFHMFEHNDTILEFDKAKINIYYIIISYC